MTTLVTNVAADFSVPIVLRATCSAIDGPRIIYDSFKKLLDACYFVCMEDEEIWIIDTICVVSVEVF